MKKVWVLFIGDKRLTSGFLLACSIFLYFFYILTLKDLIAQHVHEHSQSLQELVEHTGLLLCCALALALFEASFRAKGWLKDVATATDTAFIRHVPIMKAAGQLGLTAVYRDRSDAAPDILASIESAKDKVLLLGVSLTKDLTLDGRLGYDLAERKQNNQTFDLRILLMDAVSVPAVSRMVLEGSRETAEELYGFLDKKDLPGAAQRFTREHLYSDVSAAATKLVGVGYQGLREYVKFYEHAAICWMAVADDVLYHQPYSFGRDPNDGIAGKLDKTIGPHLPVFKYERKNGEYPFNVFENHFEKLWKTSILTPTEEFKRINTGRSLMEVVLGSYGRWVKNACDNLRKP